MKKPIVPVPASILQADALEQQAAKKRAAYPIVRLRTTLTYEALKLWDAVQALPIEQAETLLKELEQEKRTLTPVEIMVWEALDLHLYIQNAKAAKAAL